MIGRCSGALLLAALAAAPLLAERAPVSVCLVQTKLDAEKAYDPPAGPWSIELYKLLSARRLRNGAALEITVLPASTEKEVPPQIHQLSCTWVVQLRLHGAFWPGGRYTGDDEDTILFDLWNSESGKVVGNGAALVNGIPGQERLFSDKLFEIPCSALAQQIVKKLNRLR